MLGIFSKGLVDPPKELNWPPNSKEGKSSEDIIRIFQQFYSQNIPLSLAFYNNASLAFSSSNAPQQRIFCEKDNMYCIFLGYLNNLSTLVKQYGLGKNTNEAMFALEAYRTLRDRRPYPPDQVLRELEGSFGYLIYDQNASTIFVALGEDQRVKLFWGIGADGSLIIWILQNKVVLTHLHPFRMDVCFTVKLG